MKRDKIYSRLKEYCMLVIERFKQLGELWSDVEYTETGWTFHDRNPSDKRRGVYAFIGIDGIEKVGKIENAKGVAARTYQYSRSLKRITEDRNDASDTLWHEVMTNDLKGQALEFYFLPVESKIETIHGVEIEIDGIRALEKQLSTLARVEDNPMRLSGKGN